MRKVMPPEDRQTIQIRVLEMCNNTDGATSLEIWEDKALARMRKRYKRGTFKDIVHSLKGFNLLFDHKKTKGNCYFITLEGQEWLAQAKVKQPKAKPKHLVSPV